MSSAFFLFGRRRPTQIGQVEVDSEQSSSPSFNADVTHFPIEDGGQINDHIIQRPTTVQMRAIVTSMPLFNITEMGDGRITDAYNELLKMTSEREVFDLIFSLDVYENMVITNFSPTMNHSNGDSLTFSISMQQVRFSQSQLVPREGQQRTTPPEGDGNWSDRLKKEDKIPRVKIPDANERGIELTRLIQESIGKVIRPPSI